MNLVGSVWREIAILKEMGVIAGRVEPVRLRPKGKKEEEEEEGGPRKRRK